MVEAVRRKALLCQTTLGISPDSIHREAVRALAVPLRKKAECYWKVLRPLKNRGVPLVSQLEAVIPKDLAEVIQFGPCLVTCRTGKSVLTSECRYSKGRLRCGSDKYNKK